MTPPISTRFSKGKFEPVPVRASWSGGMISGIEADGAGDVWIMDVRGEAVRVRDSFTGQAASGSIREIRPCVAATCPGQPASLAVGPQRLRG